MTAKEKKTPSPNPSPKSSEPHPGGRPPKYTEEWMKDEAIALLEWIKDEKNDPTTKIYLGSFALERGYPRQKLSMFAEKNIEFRDAYEQAKTWQENKFLFNGLNRKWDAGFTQYVMARVCMPEWKKTWDREEEKADTPTTVIINKIEK